MQITQLIKENDAILKLGLNFEFPYCRIKVHEKLKKNLDASKSTP